MPELEKPLNILEAAEYTGLAVSYLYKLCHLKKIPYYKPLGGRVVFNRMELSNFMFRGKRSADYELEGQVNEVLMHSKRGEK